MKRSNETFSKLIWILVLILPALIIQLMGKSAIVMDLASVIQSYLPLYLLVLLILKALGIIYPPLPGAVFTIVSIPLIGWQLAYLIDIVGSILGTSMAFLWGKKYGYKILVKVIGEKIANKIINIKLKQRNQIEAAVVLRLAGGGLLSDGLAWGSGLIGFKYTQFIVGHVISHIITTLPIFYLLASSMSINSGLGILLITGLSWVVVYKFKGRYFE